MRTYKAIDYQRIERIMLRDLPGKDVPQPVQIMYLSQVIGLFLRTFVKVYSSEELADKDRADLRRFLDKVIEAKDALDGRFERSGK